MLHELIKLGAEAFDLANDLCDGELRRIHSRVLGRDVAAGFFKVCTSLVGLRRDARKVIAEVVDAAMVLDQSLVGFADEDCVLPLVTLQGLDPMIEGVESV